MRLPGCITNMSTPINAMANIVTISKAQLATRPAMITNTPILFHVQRNLGMSQWVRLLALTKSMSLNR
jgi:hypothetical protein